MLIQRTHSGGRRYRGERLILSFSADEGSAVRRELFPALCAALGWPQLPPWPEDVPEAHAWASAQGQIAHHKDWNLWLVPSSSRSATTTVEAWVCLGRTVVMKILHSDPLLQMEIKLAADLLRPELRAPLDAFLLKLEHPPETTDHVLPMAA